MPRAYGHDRIEALPEGRVALVCQDPKGWEARRAAPAMPNRVDHPGTAVLWDEEHWEVLSFERRGAGYRYVLARWDEQHVFRGVVPYDEGTEAEREELRREQVKVEGQRGLLVLLTPFVGLLPEEDQVALENRLGVSAGRMTFVSAMLGLLFGCYSVIMLVAGALGGAGATSLFTFVLLVGAYLFPESFARLIVVAAQGRPIGSLLALPWVAVKALRARPERREELATYDREKEREVERQRTYRALQPVLGLLPAEHQILLCSRYGFDALSWGKTTAWILLVWGWLLVGTAVMNVLARTGGAGELLWLGAGVWLVLEQLGRLAAIRSGRPAGSVLGRVFVPFARPLLVRGTASAERGRTTGL